MADFRVDQAAGLRRLLGSGQQLQVVTRVVADLDLPIRILPHPTRREPDGLAMSSRNVRLTPAERALAPMPLKGARGVAVGCADLAEDLDERLLVPEDLQPDQAGGQQREAEEHEGGRGQQPAAEAVELQLEVLQLGHRGGVAVRGWRRSGG